MSSTKQPREKKKASLGFSILTVLVLIAFITLMLTVGKAPIVVVMILAWLVLVPFALYLGYSMHETEKFALDLIKPAIGVIALLIAVGGMVSIWLCAGTVPALIYWGLKIISPGAFLLVAFILTSIVALPTGTSWGTVATIGVAMMGVGLGLQIPAREHQIILPQAAGLVKIPEIAALLVRKQKQLHSSGPLFFGSSVSR